MIFDLLSLLDFFSAPIPLGGLAASGSAVGTYFVARNKSVRTEVTEARRDGMAERAMAFTEVMRVIETLRVDIGALRLELEAERALRRAAELTARMLLEEVALLRMALQRANVTIPGSLLKLETETLPITEAVLPKPKHK